MRWDVYLPHRYVIVFISSSSIAFAGCKVGCYQSALKVHQSAKEYARVLNSALKYEKVRKVQKTIDGGY